VSDRYLKQAREKVRGRQYLMTTHAEEEMDEDGLTIFDVEEGILTGRVIARQRDRETHEWKHVIEGRTLAGGKRVLRNTILPHQSVRVRPCLSVSVHPTP
jgi:hypothetical protein